MILDIIIIAIVLLFFFIGLRRGLIKSIYGLLCITVAGVLAYIGGRFLAELVYNNLIFKSVSESISSAFNSAAVNPNAISKSIFDSLPDMVTGILSGFGVTQKGFASSLGSASAVTEKTVISAVNSTIGPVIISVLSVAFIILIFLIALLLFRLLVGRLILKLAKLPIIRWVNSLLGGILGIGEGVLIVIALIILFKISMMFMIDSFISKEMIDSSFLFKALYNWDFTAMFSNITV